MIIAKVFYNKHSKQKLVTIPKGSLIMKGDYVKITLINEPGEVNENDTIN